MSKEDLAYIVKKHKKERKLLRSVFFDKYSDLSMIDENLYLTGFGGLTNENFAAKNIKCVVNATFEVALLDIKSIQTIRVPVSYSLKYSLLLNHYFHKS